MIAVTGAAGLVGRAVVADLARAGIAARAILRPGGRRLDAATCEVVDADLSDAPALAAAFAGADAVIHAAARMSGEPAELERTNVDGTRNVIEAAVGAGVRRLVFVSSVVVYGAGDLVDVDEDRPRRPQDVYAASKVAAEDVVRAACAERRIDAWILRPATVWAEDDARFTAWLVALARDGVIPLVNDGAVRMDLVAAADVAQACRLAATVGAAGGGRALNVTSDEGLTVSAIVERLRGVGLRAATVRVEDPEEPPPGVARELVAAVREHRSFGVGRARAEIGFAPRGRFPGGG